MSPYQVQVQDRSPLLAHAAAWGHGETQSAGSCIGTLGSPLAALPGAKGKLGKEGRKEGAQGESAGSPGERGTGPGGRQGWQGTDPGWKGALDRRAGLWDRTTAEPWISPSKLLSQDLPGAGEMEEEDEHSPPAARIPQQSCSFPGSTLAQIRSPMIPRAHLIWDRTVIG